MTIKRILVPVDFSPNSLQAVDHAVALANPLRAEIVLLFVVELKYYVMPDLAGPVAADLLEQQRRSGRALVARLVRRYAKPGLKIRAVLEVGTAHVAILDTAKRLKADLIVMATHGRSGLSRMLMGSVAERVVRLASCPVLTLRPTTGRRAGARKAARRAEKARR